MTNDQVPFGQRKRPVFVTGAMVATSQPSAVEAGLRMLRAGGNAADAAVAAAAALAVTEPCSNGMGGDCFALYYEHNSQRISCLNGSGRAPAALTLDRVTRDVGADLPWLHAHTVTVPGAVAGWQELLTRFGSLRRTDVLAPAIELAEGGFEVMPITAHFWGRGIAQLKRGEAGQELLIDGEPPSAGQLFRNPTVAHTLREIAEHGPDAFYGGRVGRAMVAAVQDAGGALDMADLQAHASSWGEPIHTSYRDHRLHEHPPNGQGLAALIALGILRHTDAASHRAGSARRLHYVIEALRLAFADTRWHATDPEFHEAPIGTLLSDDYLTRRAASIDPDRAQIDPERGRPDASSDTVYLSVVDAEGNACSFIQSNYMGFGTGIVPTGCGFTLQNRGHNFSLDPDHPNALAPGKRPYHTIIPALTTRADGSLHACFGVMGGFMQPQGHVQVAMAMLDDGLDPQAALNQPRLCIDPLKSRGQIALEEGIEPSVADELTAMGHNVRLVSGWDRAIFGRGQIIVRDTDGQLCGGSDNRADGCARGV